VNSLDTTHGGKPSSARAAERKSLNEFDSLFDTMETTHVADTGPPNTNHEERIVRLERALQRSRRTTAGTLLTAVVLIGAAWTGRAAPGATVLHARGLVIEDSLGHARVVLGAPLLLPGRNGADGGVGLAVLSPSGRLRVAVGAPEPAPQTNGKLGHRMGGDAGGGASGLVFFDTVGDERGGIGVDPTGTADVCVDYAQSEKEAACLVVAPKNVYAGLTVNGPPGQGYERAGIGVAGANALVKVGATDGNERAILKASGMNAAELLVYDTAGHRFVNVLAPTHLAPVR